MNKASTPRKPHVEIFQNTMTHYRVPIFAEVARSEVFDCTVCFGEDPKESGQHMPEGSLGFSVVFNGMWKIKIGKRNPLYFQMEEIRAALGRKYDVLIHTADFHVLTYPIATFLAKLRGKKVIHWTHGTSRGGPRSGLKERIRRFLHRRADALLLYGEREYKHYQKMGFPMDKVFMTHNSLYTPPQIALRDATSAEDIAAFRRDKQLSEHILVYAGRLLDEKRVDQVIRALPTIRHSIPDAMFVAIGQGPERENLLAVAAELGVSDSVQLPGAIYDEEILSKYYMASSLAVCPGCVGLMVNHAFVYGVPVVTTDDYWYHGPEVAMITEGVTGMFFADKDPASLADVIVALLSDPLRLHDMSRACIRLIDAEYNVHAVTKAFDDVVRYVLNKQPNPRPTAIP